MYACADSGQNLIKEEIQKHNLNRVVVSACSVRMHEPTFRAVVKEAGLNPFLMEMANIREQCTWAHGHHPGEALEKAKSLTAAAVAKARFLTPLDMIKVPVTQKAMVVGGGVAGINAALDLADQGVETILVEKEPTIGGVMAQLNKTFPTMDCSI
jgi:heterodisulfide reductase subunit A